MGDPRRPDRVAEAIREEVATFLSEGAKDPRIRGFVTVTAVEMTRDLRHATVFVSIMSSDDDRTKTLEGLASVATHLRSRLGKSLRLRNAPEITFRVDESVAHASRIEELLAQVRRERESVEPHAAGDATPDTPPDASDDSADRTD
jgi:ribosome-binding factor A